MKIKNIYVWLCVIWITATIFDCATSVINFVNGKVGLGFIFLVVSVGFSFISGILMEKAICIYLHNKEVDWLNEIAEELREEYYNSIEQFEDFKENE